MEDDLGGRVVDSSVPFLVRGRAKTQVGVHGLSVKLLFPQIRLSLTWQAKESCQQLSGYPSTCPTEPLPTGDRCFLYPPGWPAFMSGKLNISKLFPGSCSLFLRVHCQFLLALVGGGTSGKFFIMN